MNKFIILVTFTGRAYKLNKCICLEQVGTAGLNQPGILLDLMAQRAWIKPAIY